MRLPISLMSPAGNGGRLSILIFHRVLAAPDPLAPDEPDVHRFEQQLRWVRDWFNVVRLSDGVDLLYEGRLPARALAITFDDGYSDNEQLAAPILRKLGLTATIFVSAGYMAGGCMWNDRITDAMRHCPLESLDLGAAGLGRFDLRTPAERYAAVATVIKAVRRLGRTERMATVDAIAAAAHAPAPPELMMRPEQVRNLRRLGLDVGAHTLSHPILTRIDSEEARREIGGSRALLEDTLDEKVDLFAYPNGVPTLDYAPEHVEMVRQCGFKAAVSTAWGAASMQSDRHQLPRFTPWDRSRLRYGLRMVGNFRRRETTV